MCSFIIIIYLSWFKINDLVKEMRQWEIRANKIGAEFGFSPQARTKINLGGGKKENPLTNRLKNSKLRKAS